MLDSSRLAGWAHRRPRGTSYFAAVPKLSVRLVSESLMSAFLFGGSRLDRWHLQRRSLALLFGALACAGSKGPSSSREGLDWGNNPPARPGSSITHTQMCECTVCTDRACCGGADESQATCESGDPDVTPAGENVVVDFTKDDGCGVELRSCTASCARKVWRLAQAAHCDTGRPAQCCD
jgi:hypothetical protein